MSTRSLGMVGKTYRSSSEAFKDADYATAIQRPEKANTDGFVAFLLAMMFIGVFAYGFYRYLQTI